MSADDVQRVVALQTACFPPPFPQDLLWTAEHLLMHLRIYPQGQFVADHSGEIIGSASSCLITEENWRAHGSWDETVGGPYLHQFDPDGTTLYGLDVSVNPTWRKMGVGRALYDARQSLVRESGLTRYGTACRLPGFRVSGEKTAQGYAEKVVAGELSDQTLTPLSRYGLTLIGVLEGYMHDPESGDAAALLEWRP